MLVVVCFAALPKIYIHKLLGHTHIVNTIASNKHDVTSLNEDVNTKGCDLEKFETPVYFTIFKFINNCNPFKSASDVTDNYKTKNPSTKKVIFSQLRAPPAV